MKKEIHPQVFNSTIHCVGCGFSFTCSTTVTDMRISVCSMCHPFYTGKQKLVDAEGRVDRFNRKYGKPSSKTEVPREESIPAVDTAV